MTQYPKYKDRRGFTLTELGIVIGVMGLVLATIWAAASSVYTSVRVEKASQELLAIAGGTLTLFQQNQIPSGPLSPVLINNKIVPPDMIAPCAGSQWGGALYGGLNGCSYMPWENVQLIIGSQTLWNGAPISPSMFEMMMGPLTASQCASFLPAFVKTAAGKGLVWVWTANTGGIAVDPTVTISQFIGCNGNVVLQFSQ